MTFTGIEQALKASDIVLPDKDRNEFMVRFIQGLEPALETPRKAKQYANNLLFALPLLKGEVHVVDLLLMEGIRAVYPNLYTAIRGNPTLFLKGGRGTSRTEELKAQVESCIDAALEADKAIDRHDIKHMFLEQLFPKLQEIFSNTRYGTEWNAMWSREQRVCSERYFGRFFSYGVTSDDVSDISISQVIDALVAGDAVDKHLTAFARDGVMNRVIEKFREREADIPAAAIPALVMTIARNGALLPRE